MFHQQYPQLVLLFILCTLFSQTSAHFDDKPNNQVNAWDKLVLEVKYDTEKGVISVRGHSHHPENTLLILTVQNAYEKDLLVTQEVRVRGSFFSCSFGPYITPEKRPAPGYYQITVWFMHKRQTPEMQHLLNTSNFYNCSPPCPIDHQHYQQDVVQIGTEEEIEEELKTTIKQYEAWIDRAYDLEKEAKRYLTKFIRDNRSKNNWESINSEFTSQRESFMAKVTVIREEIEQLRNAKSLVYFNKILDEIMAPIDMLYSDFSNTKKALNNSNPKKAEDVLKGLENYLLKDMKKKLKASIQEPEKEEE